MLRSRLVLLVLTTACADGATEPRLERVSSGLQLAPATAIIAGQTVTIEPYLWRDFQPGTPSSGPPGRPLAVALRVRTSDGAALAMDVAADSVWVVNGDRAWAARAVQEVPRSLTGAYLEVMARNGPRWEPGLRVDVVARVRDGAGRVAYLRAADQLINRAD